MILAIDIGNTNISLGAFAAETLVHQDRIPVEDAARIERFWWTSELSERGPFDIALVSSVRPSTEALLTPWLADVLHLPICRAGTEFSIPLVVKVDAPGSVGRDRLLAAYAAYRRARGAAIVVSFGTAITVNAVNAAGEFVGGAIGPGVGLSADALARGCEQLPRVTPAREPHVLATDTNAAIRSALYHGFAGFVVRLIAGAANELGGSPPVFATGGDAPLFALALPGVEIVPHLVLEGLVQAYFSAGVRR